MLSVPAAVNLVVTHCSRPVSPFCLGNTPPLTLTQESLRECAKHRPLAQSSWQHMLIPHFTDKETEVQRGKVPCRAAQSLCGEPCLQGAAQPRAEPDRVSLEDSPWAGGGEATTVCSTWPGTGSREQAVEEWLAQAGEATAQASWPRSLDSAPGLDVQEG